MKYPLSLLLCLILIPLMAQSPLPISSYDYAIPEKNVSPIAMGSAALNLTNAQDPFAAYSNPALLAYNEHSHFFFSFRLSDTDELNFWEVASISNALKDKQFKYFTAVAGKVGFSYQPVSSINISAIDKDAHKSLYYDYNLDKVQLSLGITDKNWPHMALGLNLKYLSGRLVFLEEQIIGSNLLRIHFIDDKVKAFPATWAILTKQAIPPSPSPATTCYPGFIGKITQIEASNAASPAPRNTAAAHPKPALASRARSPKSPIPLTTSPIPMEFPGMPRAMPKPPILGKASTSA